MVEASSFHVEKIIDRDDLWDPCLVKIYDLRCGLEEYLCYERNFKHLDLC